MNDKMLILLTNYYPFGKGEEYLESEIIYLSQSFKKIFVIPVMYNKKMKQTRTVPQNVEIIKVSTDHSLTGKFKLLFTKANLKERFKEFSASNIKKTEWMFEYYFYKRTGYLWDKIKNEISFYEELMEEKVVIYSYWFYLTAALGIEFKNSLELQDIEVDKLISRAHGYDINENANYLNYLPARRYLLSNYDRIFPVSSEATMRLKLKYPEYVEKIETKNLAVKGLSEATNIIRTNDKLIIVTCSSIRPLKRLDLLIDSLSILTSKDIEFEWVHIGTGEKKYERKIIKYAKKKLLKNSFKFIGYINNSLIRDIYSDSKYSVFINVSSSEGVPVSIMEAFSAKLPVIATDVGGTSDIVQDKKNGLLIKADISKEELAYKILSFYNMEYADYLKMSESAFLTWNKELNVDIEYKKFAYWLSKEQK